MLYAILHCTHHTHTRAHIHTQYHATHTHMRVQLLRVNHSPPPFLCALTLGLSSTALCVRVTPNQHTGELETILLVFFFTRALVEMTTVDSTIPLWLNWDQQKVIVIPQPSTSPYPYQELAHNSAPWSHSNWGKQWCGEDSWREGTGSDWWVLMYFYVLLGHSSWCHHFCIILLHFWTWWPSWCTNRQQLAWGTKHNSSIVDHLTLYTYLLWYHSSYQTQT